VGSSRRHLASERRGRALSRRTFLQLAGIEAAGLLVVVQTSLASSGDEHVVVANSSAGVAMLPLDTARRLLSAQQEYWPNGTPVLIVVPPKGSASLHWMLQGILRMPESAYRRHLMNQVFRGVARHPVATDSLEATVHEVTTRRGAISALPRSMLTSGTRVIVLR
jgi:hypothetical protein